MVAVQTLAVLLYGSGTVRCLSGVNDGNASGIRNPEVVELPAGPGSGNDVPWYTCIHASIDLTFS